MRAVPHPRALRARGAPGTVVRSVKQPAVASATKEGGMVTRTVADCMTSTPTTVDVTDTLRTAADTMAQQDVGALVVRSGRETIGIVTDRDSWSAVSPRAAAPTTGSRASPASASWPSGPATPWRSPCR